VNTLEASVLLRIVFPLWDARHSCRLRHCFRK